MKRGVQAAAIVVLCILFPALPDRHGFAAPTSAKQTALASPQVTFNRDIAPIVFHCCATCHRPGESGPFPLLTYKDTKSHARQMAAVTQTRFMPPWLPEPGEIKFADDLVLNIHLQPSGKEEWIRPSLGLYFTERPATRFPMLLQLEADQKLDIPPGDKNFLVTDEFSLPEDVALLAIYPHAHYVGKDLQAFATFPDGTKKSLIHIPSWDLNWQAVFRYQTPVELPAGTVVSMRYRYDNSDENVRNPNIPPKRVIGGNRASDEMAHLWLQVLPRTVPGGAGDPRRVLQEAMARHNVEKNPADFEGHYNLGAMLQARGEAAEAMKQYELALRIRPEDPTVNNAFAAANLAAGHSETAIRYLKIALRSRPDYFDAHYNLGTALAMQHDFAGAVEQFRAAVQLNAQDANAEANLGAALAETGDWKAAREHLEKALAIDPNLALARDNLEQVKRELPNDRR
jgi:tetratricopeptide (TPR) repeat protein